MVWIASTSPIGDMKDMELNNKNCTIVVSNMTNLELGDEGDLEDPEPSEEFKAEIRRHFELIMKNKPRDEDREKRQSSGGNHKDNVHACGLKSASMYVTQNTYPTHAIRSLDAYF